MRTKDMLLAVLVTAIWGFNFVFIKVGLGVFPPIFFCALRFIVASSAILFLKRQPGLKWKNLISVGFALGVFKFSLLYLGMKAGVPPGVASLLLQSQIVFTLILSSFLIRDRPSMLEMVGLSIAALGILGVAESQPELEMTGLGMGLIVAAAFAWGIANIILKKSGPVDMFQLVAWMSLIPPVPLLLISFTFETNQWESLMALKPSGIISLLYIGLVSTLIGFGLWGKLLSTYSPSTIAPFALLVPVFAILSSFLVLGEELTRFQLMAATLVLFGLCIAMLGSRIRLRKALAALSSTHGSCSVLPGQTMVGQK